MVLESVSQAAYLMLNFESALFQTPRVLWSTAQLGFFSEDYKGGPAPKGKEEPE